MSDLTDLFGSCDNSKDTKLEDIPVIRGRSRVGRNILIRGHHLLIRGHDLLICRLYLLNHDQRLILLSRII